MRPDYLDYEITIGAPVSDTVVSDTTASATAVHEAKILMLRRLLERQGYRVYHNKPQMQLVDGKLVWAGYNMPDIQAVAPDGRKVNIEIDTDPRQGRLHKQDVPRNDPKAKSIFLLIDPTTGRTLASEAHQGGKWYRSRKRIGESRVLGQPPMTAEEAARLQKTFLEKVARTQLLAARRRIRVC